MEIRVIVGLLIPFICTTLGSASVFLFKKELSEYGMMIICALSAGLMSASAIFGLLFPAMEKTKQDGGNIGLIIGFISGFVFILAVDLISEKYVKPSGSVLLAISMIFHNIPEGIAVGAIFAVYMSGDGTVGYPAALSLSLGIALQNIPEGAVVSIPKRKEGKSRTSAFLGGMLTGIVEPVMSFSAVIFSEFISSCYVFTLGFAAGSMIYVVIKELIPDIYSDCEHFGRYSLCFLAGFMIMTVSEII